jgi:nicotinate-nucleotide pyrophosphorylase (carboxylating)
MIASRDLLQPPWESPGVVALLRAALEEDIGTGDVTTEAIVPEAALARAHLIARRPTVAAALPLSARLLAELDSRARVEICVPEGARVAAGTCLVRLQGRARALLMAERTLLNLLGRLCGIATLTRAFVDALEGTGVLLRDTRKTTPLWRALEKYAVRTGGGTNHRFGLFDGILIKENHAAVAGGVAEAVRRARAAAISRGLRIEAEVRNEDELHQALEAGADELLLDNVGPAEGERLVALARRLRPDCRIEISGGITLATVRAYAAARPDFISVGAITHSAPAADLSLLFEPQP